MKFKLNRSAVVALFGMAILQSNAMPYLIKAWQGNLPTTIVPAFMTVVGLLCYLYYAIKRRDPIYIIGNTIGIVSNTILIGLFYFN